MISCGEAVPSTPIEFVRRDTEQEVTPGTLPTAFSTRAWQAAQLIPVTVYCSNCAFFLCGESASRRLLHLLLRMDCSSANRFCIGIPLRISLHQLLQQCDQLLD